MLAMNYRGPYRVRAVQKPNPRSNIRAMPSSG